MKLTKMTKAMLITSPMNMMKQQDLFSQTGKFNEQMEADNMFDETS